MPLIFSRCRTICGGTAVAASVVILAMVVIAIVVVVVRLPMNLAGDVRIVVNCSVALYLLKAAVVVIAYDLRLAGL